MISARSRPPLLTESHCAWSAARQFHDQFLADGVTAHSEVAKDSFLANLKLRSGRFTQGSRERVLEACSREAWADVKSRRARNRHAESATATHQSHDEKLDA